MSEQETLAWEVRWRNPAIFATCLAALLPVASFVIRGSALSNAPDDSLSRARLFDDHSGQLLVSAILLGLGALALAGSLTFLYRATRNRRSQTPRIALICAWLGGLGGLVGLLAFQIVQNADISSFLGGPRFWDDIKAHDLVRGQAGAAQTFGTIIAAAQLAAGFALVIVSLNAMRVGLLTRFMGILGIIAGVFSVLLPIPLVQFFWLGALAYLLNGRWPNGVPPAWVTGRAEPWPSQQDVREARDRGDVPARSSGGGLLGRLMAPPAPPAAAGPEGSDAEAPEPEPAPGAAHPASKKRKRKRRR